jgi:hypothetical protein
MFRINIDIDKRHTHTCLAKHTDTFNLLLRMSLPRRTELPTGRTIRRVTLNIFFKNPRRVIEGMNARP